MCCETHAESCWPREVAFLTRREWSEGNHTKGEEMQRIVIIDGAYYLEELTVMAFRAYDGVDEFWEIDEDLRRAPADFMNGEWVRVGAYENVEPYW